MRLLCKSSCTDYARSPTAAIIKPNCIDSKELTMQLKLIVFALILCVAMPTLAQVEFKIEVATFDALDDAPLLAAV